MITKMLQDVIKRQMNIDTYILTKISETTHKKTI